MIAGAEYYQPSCGERKVESSEFESAKVRALRILGTRSLSMREIEKRLVGKGESVDIARQTVSWLEETGLINDMEYANSIVSHYISKGYGIARVKDELYKRGIDREMWEEALSGVGEMEDAACNYIEKKLKGSNDKDEMRRVTNALCRRGFSYEEACGAMNRYLESLEESEDI